MKPLRAADLPPQSQLLLPLLQAISQAGGAARPGELYDRLAATFALTEHERNARTRAGQRDTCVWERHVRWTRQTAVLHQLIARDGPRGLWELTDHANVHLHNARAGTIVTVFETENGTMLWARAEDAVAAIERESVQLIFTSPPYPLTQPRAYGNVSAKDWIEWMLRHCASWRELLTSDGSMMLNVGTIWNAQEPTVNDYIERLTIRLQETLGLHYLQRLEWYNRTKLAQPMQWVAIDRVRVIPATEAILWMGAQPHTAADNRRVLRPYGKRMHDILAKGQPVAKRPSGDRMRPSSFARDNGGSIPSNVIDVAHAASNDPYQRACRRAGVEAHPARFPREVAAFGIKLASAPQDLVVDLFAGSGTVAAEAERLDRRWICGDQSRAYLKTAALRFPQATYSVFR